MEPNLGPTWDQVGAKIEHKIEHKSKTRWEGDLEPCWTGFRLHVGSIFGAFLASILDCLPEAWKEQKSQFRLDENQIFKVPSL